MDMVLSTSEFTELRKSLLGDVSGDVFEIGFGTGLNLPHYPSNVKRITTVDPNPGARKLAERRIAQSAIEVVHLPLTGEHLDVPDESFNSVVYAALPMSIPPCRKCGGFCGPVDACSSSSTDSQTILAFNGGNTS
jgi:hypothetical protein